MTSVIGRSCAGVEENDCDEAMMGFVGEANIVDGALGLYPIGCGFEICCRGAAGAAEAGATLVVALLPGLKRKELSCAGWFNGGEVRPTPIRRDVLCRIGLVLKGC